MKTKAAIAAMIAGCLWLTAAAQQAQPPATGATPKEKPSEFYLRYRAAVPNATTMDDVLTFWRAQAVSEFKEAPPDQRVDLAALKRAYTMVADVKVTEETSGASGATLKLAGTTSDQKTKTCTVYLVNEGGDWKVFGPELWQ
jgi:hypothetical protein